MSKMILQVWKKMFFFKLSNERQADRCILDLYGVKFRLGNFAQVNHCFPLVSALKFPTYKKLYGLVARDFLFLNWFY